MRNEYSWALDLDYIAHYGKGHDDGPPGRGSGRYAWGSGAKWGKTPLGKGINKIKKFFHKNRVEKAKQAKAEEDELFGLVRKESDGTKLTPEEEHRLNYLLDRKYGSAHSTSDMVINRMNAQRDLEASMSDEEKRARAEAASQKAAQQHEADRKAAFESGDRNEISKYFNESSYNELQAALNKANLKDQMNRSIYEVAPNGQTYNKLREDYVRQELWSGDLNRIMAVASDKAINNQELENAIKKADQYNQLNRKLNPTTGDKILNTIDKTMDVYNKVAPIYNIGATVNNQMNKDNKLPILPVAQKNNNNNNNQNQNQKQNQNQNNNQQNNSLLQQFANAVQQNDKQQNKSKDQLQQDVLKTLKETKESTQKLNQSVQQNQQPIQGTYNATPAQQQASQEVVNWLNTDVLTSNRNEKFYQNTIVTLNKPINSQEYIEYTPAKSQYNDTNDVKWLKMTIDPSVLNKKL